MNIKQKHTVEQADVDAVTSIVDGDIGSQIALDAYVGLCIEMAASDMLSEVDEETVVSSKNIHTLSHVEYGTTVGISISLPQFKLEQQGRTFARVEVIDVDDRTIIAEGSMKIERRTA